MPDFEFDIIQSDHVCEKNIETQFSSEVGSECGDGINDRITSEGVGRVTSEGECRIIA